MKKFYVILGLCSLMLASCANGTKINGCVENDSTSVDSAAVELVETVDSVFDSVFVAK